MKIGIITMHRVVNYGSALQAFALQQALLKMGYDNELIDYVFPSPQKRSLYKSIETRLRRFIYLLKVGKLFRKTKEARFREFRKKYLMLSVQKYNQTNILKSPPIYDIYMTGSDQVWNPQWIKNDTSFFLSFAPKNSIKLSYASSFTVNHIDNKYLKLYAQMLSRYQHITVREDSGIEIVKELTGEVAECVCDPTLLLAKDDYEPLIQMSKVSMDGPYVLVYLLTYMFDPYPKVNQIVASVSEKLGLSVVYLDGNKYVTYSKACKTVSEVGPNEFLWLFKNADFIITTSYHGCVFASIFTKPLLAVINHGENDHRIISLLNKMQNTKSVVFFDSNVSIDTNDMRSYVPKIEKMEEFRSYSIRMLKKMLINNYYDIEYNSSCI